MTLEQPKSNEHFVSRRRHVFGFGALVALALMLVAISLNALHASQVRKEAGQWRAHTLNVMLAAEAARATIYEMILDGAGYQITRDPAVLSRYDKARAAAPRSLLTLKELTRDSAAQQANIAVAQARLDRLLTHVDGAHAAIRQDAQAEAARQVDRSIQGQEVETLIAAIATVASQERNLLRQREVALVRAQTVSELAQLALVVIGLVFLGVVGWAGVTASRARMRTLEVEGLLRRAATTDELTGLLNRRAFLAALDTEITRSRRSGSPLALALIDLDHFKSVNDRFGHAGGDEVLRRFADTAREAMRTTDVIGRLGGEEFAVLMPDTDQVQSGIAGERLRDAVARRRVVLSTGGLAPVTISVGVAHYRAGEERDRLIIRADEALYEAKDSGRNRTRLAA